MLLHRNAAGRRFEATMTAAVGRLTIQTRTILLTTASLYFARDGAQFEQ